MGAVEERMGWLVSGGGDEDDVDDDDGGGGDDDGGGDDGLVVEIMFVLLFFLSLRVVQQDYRFADRRRRKLSYLWFSRDIVNHTHLFFLYK